MENKYKTMCDKVIKIVVDANKKFIENKKYNIYKKGKENFYTTVDIKIEKYLKKELLKINKNYGIINEESENHIKEEGNWCIDPIDGTTNFLCGFAYTISVALKCKDEYVLGVVYVPFENKLFYAIKNGGAYCIFNNKKRKLKITNTNKINGIMIFGLPYDRKKTDKIFSIAKEMFAVASDLKRIGPASYDICRVADNNAVAYFELDLEEWDIAAGIVILKEAGGEFVKKKDIYIFSSKQYIKKFDRIIKN